MISREEALLYSRLPIFQRRLKQAHVIVDATLVEAKKPYVAFSTGKDSTCVLDLVLQRKPEVDVVYFDADCAYPESLDLLKIYEGRGVRLTKWKTEPLLETYRRIGGFETDRGFVTMETTVWEPMRRLIAERNYDWCFLGLRAGESRMRRLNASKRGEIYYCAGKGIAQALPIQWWTEHDVWAHVHSRDLPYNMAYDKGVDRVSYWAGETNRQRGRWVELKRHWPDLYNRFAAEFPEVREYV